MEYAALANGLKIPMVGLGVYQVSDLKQCEDIVTQALRLGYRLLDTAENYRNEEAVGYAMKKSGVPREEIFVTTKIWKDHCGRNITKEAVKRALKRLDTEYLDLMLLHQALGDYYGAWRDLEDLCREGLVRAIGVSNFYPDRMADLCCNSAIAPMVNQIECHPFYQKNEDIKCAARFKAVIEAWGPFAEGGRGIFENEVIKEIAQNHGKTPAQVILRWNTQRGVVVIPKTVHPERLSENLDIFDFKLTDEEMAKMAGLDTGHTQIIDHLDWKTTIFLNDSVHGRED